MPLSGENILSTVSLNMSFTILGINFCRAAQDSSKQGFVFISIR